MDLHRANTQLLKEAANDLVNKKKEELKTIYAYGFQVAPGKTEKMKDAETLTGKQYMDKLQELSEAKYEYLTASREVELWDALIKGLDKLHFTDIKNADRYMLEQGRLGGAATRAGRVNP